MLSSAFSLLTEAGAGATTGAGAAIGAGAGVNTAAAGAGAMVSTGAGVETGAITGASGSGANGFLYSLFVVMTSRELGL
jgi:hypothetical protein